MMVVTNQREGHIEVYNLFFVLRWFIIMFSTLWVLIPWRLSLIFAAALMQFPEKSKMLLVPQVGVFHKAWGGVFLSENDTAERWGIVWGTFRCGYYVTMVNENTLFLGGQQCPQFAFIHLYSDRYNRMTNMRMFLGWLTSVANAM